MKVNQGAFVLSFVFMMVSLISIGIMVFLAFRFTWIKNEMIEIDSTIISITYDNDSHLVIIEYVYDDVIYTNQYHIYSSNMREGDIIKIYIDPNFPEINYQPNIFFYFIFPGIFAVVFGAIGFTGVFSGLKKNRLKVKFLTSGKKVAATVVDINTNYHVRMTIGRNISYRSHLTCKVIDEFSSSEKIYQSRSFWLPSGHGIQIGVSKIDVWIDTDNKNNYFVDIDSISTQTLDAFHH